MKLNERDITKSFLHNIALDNDCHICCKNPCICEGCDTDESHNVDYRHDNMRDDSSHQELEVQFDGTVTPDSLYQHFDLDSDGRVTPQEYQDHINFHCAHPQTLDHYNNLRKTSHQHVPCTNSYDSCSQFFMADPESIQTILQPLLSMTSSTCPESALSGMSDVLKCLKEKDLI